MEEAAKRLKHRKHRLHKLQKEIGKLQQQLPNPDPIDKMIVFAAKFKKVNSHGCLHRRGSDTGAGQVRAVEDGVRDTENQLSQGSHNQTVASQLIHQADQHKGQAQQQLARSQLHAARGKSLRQNAVQDAVEVRWCSLYCSALIVC